MKQTITLKNEWREFHEPALFNDSEKSYFVNAETGKIVSMRGVIVTQQEANDLTMNCPLCGDNCMRDEVDIGVGTIYGPFGCQCGWSESAEYDRSNGESPANIAEVDSDRVTDQFGVSHSKTRQAEELAVLEALILNLKPQATRATR
jgi:hypothetical protein